MASTPFISIIIAVKNSEKTISRCLQSIVDQDYSHKEIILIDGQSTDKTLSILKEHFMDQLGYFVSESDKGIYQAFNKGVRAAKGEWILIIGSDDFLYEKNTLTSVIPSLVKAKEMNIPIVYGKTKMFLDTVDQKILWKEERGQEWGQLKSYFKTKMVLPHPSSFQHSSIFTEGHYFDESFRIAGDFHLFLKVLLKNEPLFVNKIISAASLSGVSSNPHYSKILLNEMIKARSLNGLYFYPISFMIQIIKNKIKALF